MVAAQPEIVDTIEMIASAKHGHRRVTLSDATSGSGDEREPTDTELAALSALEEEALFGSGRGQQGGASGSDDAFQSYLQDIRGLARLSLEDELTLAKRSAAGDLRARMRLVEANLRLVIVCAQWYMHSGVPLIDLIQEGNLGLMRAAAKFDWRRGCHFSTYAHWWIRQAVRRAAGEQSRLIHVPEHVANKSSKVRRMASYISWETGADPTPAQIAQASGMSIMEVEGLLQLREQPISLDETADTEHGLLITDTLEDPSTQAPEDVVTQHILCDEMRCALQGLTPRERSAVMLRFGIGDGQSRSLQEVGEELRISRERARQLITAALDKLRGMSIIQSLPGSA
jgi:RNA polymerase primary sigma factor